MPVGAKRYLLTALAILACLFLFTRHQSSYSNHSADSASKTATGSAGNAAGAKAVVDTTSKEKEQTVKTKYGASKDQKPLVPGPDRPLVERLRYQYPYDPEGKFPSFIWQTWKVTAASGEFAENLRPQEASWTDLHPNFVHEVITDSTALNLVRYLYSSVPEVLEAYESMPLAVLKADFFRYLILHARGGIYSDIDTTALKPAFNWIPKEVSPSSVGLVVGIEADPDREDWRDWYSRRIQFCQWTIQSKAGHPALRTIIAQITEDTLRRKRNGFGTAAELHKEIIEYTGPARWTDVILSYMNDKDFFKMEESKLGHNITWKEFTGMTKPRRVGDVVVLPITSFSPDVGTMGAGTAEDPMAYVKHDFEGSWKYSSEHVKPVVEVTVAA